LGAKGTIENDDMILRLNSISFPHSATCTFAFGILPGFKKNLVFFGVEYARKVFGGQGKGQLNLLMPNSLTQMQQLE
jgi:hypothetical protein